MKRPPIVYYYRGQIERGADYHWCNGYSQGEAGAVQYLWLTYREAEREARAQGGKAVFKTTPREAKTK